MRRSGVLLHITSLPSPGGIGDLGPEAYAFADFLQSAGFSLWQVLPLGPVGYGESPYQSSSAFAGNPLLISLSLLRDQGLLDYADSELPGPADPEAADYAGAEKVKTALLRRAFRQSGEKLKKEISVFRQANPWVEDYALFSAVKDQQGGRMWNSWSPRGIRNHRFTSLLVYRSMLREEITFRIFCQMLFFRQWRALKAYCNARGILLMGDMPIYVSEDSADTWAHPQVFELDRNRLPVRVAGVPPDYFSEDGQLWGNPLYRWDYLRENGYYWWVDRMRATAGLFDLVRIDHFIGFGHYYAIPYGAPNARGGEWVDGPGIPFFKVLKKEIPELRVVAEDLGEVNDQVLALMDWTGYPGMRVLSYAFGGDETNPHRPENIRKNLVYYTGTHDNDTVLGWAEKAPAEELEKAKALLGFDALADAPAAFVRAVLASPADTAILPMQDLLGLDGRARMNLPGTVGGNWRWRMLPGAASPELAKKLLAWNRETGRAPAADAQPKDRHPLRRAPKAAGPAVPEWLRRLFPRKRTSDAAGSSRAGAQERPAPPDPAG
ncbi:MAG: 4-alpha-glucanotransferase [Clostridia bacterium]|nr:4-alpha-glucanotransferase [Clostridia bacterium]